MAEIFAGPVPHLLKKLEEKVSEIQRGDRFAPVAVMGPSNEALLEARRSLAGAGPRSQVFFFNYQGFAADVLRSSSRGQAGISRIMPQETLELILDDVLRSHESKKTGSENNDFLEYLKKFAGARQNLLRAIRDLREALIPPEALSRVAKTPQDKQLASLYEEYFTRLRSLPDGWVDAAGFIEKALENMDQGVAKFKGLIHYGAWDLVGIHLKLVRQASQRIPLVWLVPSGPGPAFSKSRDFIGRHLGKPEFLGNASESESRFATNEFRIDFAHSQGVSGEAQAAVRAVAGWHLEEGIPFGQMAITFRSLEPYKRVLTQELEALGIPFSGSLSRPLLTWPAPQDFRAMLRVIREGLDREFTLELVARRNWIEAGPLGRWREECRRRGILRGYRNLKAAWPQGTMPKNLESALRTLDETSKKISQVSWPQGIRLLRRAAEVCLGDPWPACMELLDKAEEQLRILNLGGRSGSDVLVWILARMAELQEPSKPAQGLAVLDLMKIRGMTFRRAVLLGANHGSLPRRAVQESILVDSLRRRLHETFPGLDLKNDLDAEEKELFAQFLTSVHDRLLVCWQRSDEEGKAKAPSSYLREIQRVGRGRAGQEAGCRLVIHPGQSPWVLTGESWRRIAGTATLTPAEVLLGAGEKSVKPLSVVRDLMKRMSLDSPQAQAMLGHRSALESFTADPREPLMFDGEVGKDAFARPGFWSPTALEELAGCPLKFFFHRILKIPAPEQAPDPNSPTSGEIGLVLHEALDLVGKNMEMAKDLRDVEGTLARLGRQMDEFLDSSSGRILRKRLESLHPSLWTAARNQLVDWIADFLSWDLPRLQDLGVVSWDGEKEVQGDLPLPPGFESLPLHGRMDRYLIGRQGREIFQDFKSSAVWRDGVGLAQALRGTRLQMFLYGRLLQGRAAGEVLWIGPRAQSTAPARRVATDAKLKSAGKGILETLGILISLVQKGNFPFGEDPPCGTCAYQAACRHNEEPTRRRVLHAKGSQQYRQTQKKSSQNEKIMLKDLAQNEERSHD